MVFTILMLDISFIGKWFAMLYGMSQKNVLAYLDAHTYPTKSSVQFRGMVDLSMTHVTKMSRGRYFLENVQVIWEHTVAVKGRFFFVLFYNC